MRTLSSAQTVTALLAPLGRAYRRHVDRAFQGLGVSHTLALPVMLLGRLEDGVRQGALVDALGIEPPSLVPLLNQLERSGLVERRPDAADKRAKTLHLTDAGRDLAARAEVVANDVRSNLLANIPAADIEVAARVLGRLQLSLDRADV
jgi:MarR family transcriptional regulator, transcriptional regulator for hemolysin